ncbi:MAG: cyclic nucleotide-binding domain-containing protein [Desulfomonile tiedjei]|nr:cyclic nucleotide-binding domain-containing protein [Desulfomonile tiedjei]
MFLKEADLFMGLSQETMSEIGKIMVEESYNKGALLFSEGDPAQYFYVLQEGRVRLAIGKEGKIDYTVSNPGEAFGWSALVDRQCYTTAAECESPTKLIRIEKEKLNKVLERDPGGGMMFFKRLAGAIGERLIHSYNSFLSEQRPGGGASYGSGQVTDARED